MNLNLTEPLANLLRPTTLEEFFGQENILGNGKLLRKLIQSDQLHNMIFWGPPGIGKTTLAQIIAQKTKSRYISFSAVSTGLTELRAIIAEAQDYKRLGNPTIVFIDEIHRFNKSQQDALLPHTERGTITLIGATTENPSFEVNSALLSRCQVFIFETLSFKAMENILHRALQKVEEITRQTFPVFSKEAIKYLINFANGDARNLINTLEIILKVNTDKKITPVIIGTILQRKNLRYDKNSEEHYNIISALHKSMRDSDPDGALYWMQRMLSGGEDPLYIARRLIRFASEDIGMTDPHCLQTTVAAYQASHFIGMPECEVNLAQAVVHCSIAPKSNALYQAINQIKFDIHKTGNLEVPLHIRNAPTKLMKELNYGKNYKYAHNFENAFVAQEHLPSALKNHQYYHPTDRGLELKIKEKLSHRHH